MLSLHSVGCVKDRYSGPGSSYLLSPAVSLPALCSTGTESLPRGASAVIQETHGKLSPNNGSELRFLLNTLFVLQINDVKKITRAKV